MSFAVRLKMGGEQVQMGVVIIDDPIEPVLELFSIILTVVLCTGI